MALNITPSMWLTKVDARGSENIFTLKQRQVIGDFIPLGSAPSVKTFYCAEDEGFISYVTDRFGFRNSDKVWDTKKHDLVILGDSFAESACVIKELQQYFGADSAVVSLGKGGNGPLTSLAVMKEYSQDYYAKKFYHFIVSNDYSREINSLYDIDFERELLDEQLTKYLRKEYRGIGYFSKLNLAELRKFAVEYTNTVANKNERHYIKMDLANLFSYGFLRELIVGRYESSEARVENAGAKSRFVDSGALAEVYREMGRVAKASHSELVFVLLPDKQSSCKDDEKHIYLKELFKNERFETLDLWSQLCQPKYFSKSGGHFNGIGYEKLIGLVNGNLQSAHKASN